MLARSASQIRIERTAVGPCYALGVWRRLTVCVFDGVVGLAGMNQIQQASREWRRAHPGQTVDLAVVHPTRAGMTGPERDKWMEILKETESSRVVGATVLLAEGMLGSLHRGIVTSLNLIVRPPHPVKVFGDLVDALSWLTPYLMDHCKDAPLQSLAAEIEAMRADAKPSLEPPEL